MQFTEDQAIKQRCRCDILVELHKTLLKQKCFVQCNKRSQWQRGEVDNPVYIEVQRKQLVVNNGG